VDENFKLIVTEAIGLMHTIIARDKPQDPKALVTATLVDLKDSDSPVAKQHIGERSAVREPLEQAAACAMEGKSFADRWPETATKMDAAALADIEAALAAAGTKKRARAPRG